MTPTLCCCNIAIPQGDLEEQCRTYSAARTAPRPTTKPALPIHTRAVSAAPAALTEEAAGEDDVLEPEAMPVEADEVPPEMDDVLLSVAPAEVTPAFVVRFEAESAV